MKGSKGEGRNYSFWCGMVGAGLIKKNMAFVDDQDATNVLTPKNDDAQCIVYGCVPKWKMADLDHLSTYTHDY